MNREISSYFFGLLRIYEHYHEQLRWKIAPSKKISPYMLHKRNAFMVWEFLVREPKLSTLGHNLVPKFLLSNCLLLGLSFLFCFNCWEIMSRNLIAQTQNWMTLVTLFCSSELEKHSPIEPTLHTPFSQIWKKSFLPIFIWQTGVSAINKIITLKNV